MMALDTFKSAKLIDYEIENNEISIYYAISDLTKAQVMEKAKSILTFFDGNSESEEYITVEQIYNLLDDMVIIQKYKLSSGMKIILDEMKSSSFANFKYLNETLYFYYNDLHDGEEYNVIDWDVTFKNSPSDLVYELWSLVYPNIYCNKSMDCSDFILLLNEIEQPVLRTFNCASKSGYIDAVLFNQNIYIKLILDEEYRLNLLDLIENDFKGVGLVEEERLAISSIMQYIQENAIGGMLSYKELGQLS